MKRSMVVAVVLISLSVLAAAVYRGYTSDPSPDQVPDTVVAGTSEPFRIQTGSPDWLFVVSTDYGRLNRSPDVEPETMKIGEAKRLPDQVRNRDADGTVKATKYLADNEGLLGFQFYGTAEDVGRVASIHVQRDGGEWEKTYQVRIVAEPEANAVSRVTGIRLYDIEHKDVNGTPAVGMWFKFVDANGVGVSAQGYGLECLVDNIGQGTNVRFVGASWPDKDPMTYLIANDPAYIEMDNVPSTGVSVTVTLLDENNQPVTTRTLNTNDSPDAQ